MSITGSLSASACTGSVSPDAGFDGSEEQTGRVGPLVWVKLLPRPTAEMFAAILAALAAGQGVQLMPVNAEATTQQAAEMLNVSRPFLIGLLERGEIPFRLVGRHRRILFEDVRGYLREDDSRRKDAADELTRLDRCPRLIG
jgi:excisionase family DNA binding protein